MDDLATNEVEGELDAELAEMSLGQRLTALTGEETAAHVARGSDDEEGPSKASQKAERIAIQAVPASSLTRTLIQALHSSDSGLLETCLAHTNATLIQNTVKRLPPQLAVPLVTACVERLGRGKRVGRGKGGGGGAGAQRGTGLVRWVRAVLVVHGGHLLTVSIHATMLTLMVSDALPDARSCRSLVWLALNSDVPFGATREHAVAQWPPRHGHLPNRDAFVECSGASDRPSSCEGGQEEEEAAEEGCQIRRRRERE